MEFDVNKYDYKVVNGKLVVEEKKESATDWVEKMYKEYARVLGKMAYATNNPPYTYAFDNKGNIGKACCCKSDSFNGKIGVAIAYARLKGYPVHPDLLSKREKESTKILKVRTTLNEDEVLVDRPAKVGDLVQINAVAGYYSCFEPNGIYEVAQMEHNSNTCLLKSPAGSLLCFLKCEYKVIEKKKDATERYPEGTIVQTSNGRGVVIGKHDVDTYLVSIKGFHGHNGEGVSRMWGHSGTNSDCLWVSKGQLDELCTYRGFKLGDKVKTTSGVIGTIAGYLKENNWFFLERKDKNRRDHDVDCDSITWGYPFYKNSWTVGAEAVTKI